MGPGHTLTISVDSYPSPPGNPGRKKEQIQLSPLECHQGKVPGPMQSLRDRS